ncbi:MAG: heme ABC exporter ATP-binding protein CcmA [Chthoniobacterales bacterium]
MIAATDLFKAYGRKEVLRGLSFTAVAGEITLLVGPNGAGKSTTIKVLAGLIRPQNGTAQINGLDIVAQKIPAQRSLAYLPQSPSFHPRLTCLEILRFYAQLRGLARSRVEEMLDLTELREFARVRAGQLSGGMRQRLGLALLLLADAPVLLLDEPGLSLDPGWRARLQKILRAEGDRGRTVLITTHLIAEWNGVADRCLLCREGRIERELDPTDLPHDFDASEDSAPGSGRRGGPGDGDLAIANFPTNRAAKDKSPLRRVAATSTRVACAPQR